MKVVKEKEVAVNTGEDKGPEIDISQYGYNPDTKVEISGTLLIELLSSYARLSMEETKIHFNKVGNDIDYQTPVETVSAKGAHAIFMLDKLEELHFNNINAGLSVPNNEIKPSTPKFSEVVEGDAGETKV